MLAITKAEYQKLFRIRPLQKRSRVINAVKDSNGGLLGYYFYQLIWAEKELFDTRYPPLLQKDCHPGEEFFWADAEFYYRYFG